VRDRDTHSVVERLRRRSDFRAAADGVRAPCRAFVLQARRRTEDGPARVGLTVSRQVGNAVERNRVRRRLREMVRLSARASSVRLRAGHDYVLVGRRAALAVPFADMLQELAAALGRLDASRGGGTGSRRRDALHEAGSPPPQPKPRRRRSKPLARSPRHPPHER
jgi:ribonuclease P protein component